MAKSDQKIYLMVCSQSDILQKKDWLKKMPELGIVTAIEPVFIFDKFSSDITPEVWLKLAKEIYKRRDKAKGFVVFHGVDNILYTSSVLGYLVQNLSKPIIFTGGRWENDGQKKLDIRASLINASQAATFNFSEIALMFGNRLLRANQASLAGAGSMNLFNTPATGVLGRIDFSIRIFDKAVARNKGKVKFFDKLSSKVEVIDLSPVIDFKSLTKRLADKEGVIVNANGYRNIPHDLLFLLEKSAPNTPVVILSDQIVGSVLSPRNILLINNLTWEAAVTKFMWALVQSKNINKVKQLMSKDIAGESLF